MEQPKLVVHVWSDIACPWCYIGARRLDRGIKLSGIDVAVEYHAFQLDPGAPQNAIESGAEYLATHRGITVEEVGKAFLEIENLAHAEGLDMDQAKVQRTNTFLAHQLVYAAKASGTDPVDSASRGAAMVEALHRAYFADGLNVSDEQVLLDIATSQGLDRDVTYGQLQSGEFADEVRGDLNDAHSLGITGVPYFVFGGKYGMSGAQPAEAFEQMIRKCTAELEEALTNDDASAKSKTATSTIPAR